MKLDLGGGFCWVDGVIVGCGVVLVGWGVVVVVWCRVEWLMLFVEVEEGGEVLGMF